jgi:hypothetical protein
VTFETYKNEERMVTMKEKAITTKKSARAVNDKKSMTKDKSFNPRSSSLSGRRNGRRISSIAL